MRQCANFAPGPRAPEPEVRSPKHTAYGDTGDGERTGGFQISNSKLQSLEFGAREVLKVWKFGRFQSLELWKFGSFKL